MFAEQMAMAIKVHDMFKDADEYLKNKYGKDYDLVGQIRMSVYDHEIDHAVGWWEHFDEDCIVFMEGKMP